MKTCTEKFPRPVPVHNHHTRHRESGLDVSSLKLAVACVLYHSSVSGLVSHRSGGEDALTNDIYHII